LHYIPPLHGLSEYRAEAELIIFTVIDDLFKKTSISPGTIDILIVNCSLFNPTPSLADMIMRRYKLRGDIRHMQLSGMGCSAGLIAVGLARNLLQSGPPGAHALLVSTEILKQYMGNKRSMQLQNVLFRTGGAAVLLSTSKAKARFEFTHIVRLITTTQDNAYRCAFQEEDEEGNSGINLSKDLLRVAGQVLKDNITILGPQVLPVSEKLKFAVSITLRKALSGRINLYVPDFTTAFEHFCIHAGGRAVIDGVQHNLSLSDEHAEPSRMTLHRFGNTSSTSLWYQLAYIDAKGRIKKGERVWMIGFGSGYKCISVVWKCIQATQRSDMAWADCINRYPVNP
jgi:3-ketoacyl-CoA synthase